MHDADLPSSTPDALSITRDLPRLLAALERSMAGPELVAEELWRASPEDLHVAFAYELALLIRSGPQGAGVAVAAAPSPAALLALAQRTAAAGAVSWLTPVTLREQLARLEADLHAAGAWSPDRPLWWLPLPLPTAAEALWTALEEGAGGVAAPAANKDRPGWTIYPRLVSPQALDEIAREIEEAHAAGRLRLERGAIGKAAEKAPQRSDDVDYLTGREPEILAAA
ncbi:MAG TPA: hypothetical protein VGK45_02130, partial [Thermoanaerobaculia bacterium]